MDGIIPLFKPKGMTSHDCVAKIRRIISMKKVGHTGTLDPNVTGVLPICVGEATKIIPFIQDLQKEYIATVTLGKSTTTEDADGEIIAEKPLDTFPTRTRIDNALHQYLGEQTQVPPMYSAVKVRGRKLYDYARKGIEVERPKRLITIFEIEQIRKAHAPLHSFTFRVVCSKGTYIRTLCVEIGKSLGFPAHMSNLVRTKSDGISLENTISLQTITSFVEKGDMSQFMLPIEQGLTHLAGIQVDEQTGKRVLQGQKLSISQPMGTNRFKMMYNDQLLAIYEKHAVYPHLIKPVRVFNIFKSEGEK